MLQSMIKNLRFLRWMNRHLALCAISMAFLGCTREEGSLFSNPPSETTGIRFANVLDETDALNILDYLYFYNGGGVALGDINNDGLVDIFFSGNQVKNTLYLNQGGLRFKDITETAGVAGNSSWNTGAVMGDVNGDGLLDIYVCAVVGLNGFDGHNELFINNGNGTFTESAANYGLDFDTFSSSAAFLDFDLDGDLDIYLLNHAVHTQESYGRAELRRIRNYQTGDKLLRNDQGRFADVSEEAGIFGGINGYGLGVSVADFNQDGYPDIYVGNDFHEDDYYYLNNGDGTFTESLRAYFGHTSRFSMGNDVTDINHDGWPDLISLDMLPEDERVLKASEGDDNMQTQILRTERFGYHYQYSRNMLQINDPNGNFRETALLSGVAATDWSWSALFGDYNQDGEQDLFISNGIPKRPNDLDYINFVSSDQIRNKLNNTRLVDQQALDMMPPGKVHNYIFKGTEGLHFEDKSGEWIVADTLISGATAIGDLDNDGDLDLVVNNINSPASLYINKTNNSGRYLKLKFRYPGPNTLGIGTKVFSYHKQKQQYKELYTVRGFQASSEPILHFGYGTVEKVDSLRIIWPDNTSQLLTEVKTNQTLELRPEDSKPFDYKTLKPEARHRFDKVPGDLSIDFTHVEDKYLDFNRQKLIPYKISDRGPATAIGDIDGDGREDVFFGGSKFIPSRVFVQADSGYVEKRFPELARDSIKEDVAAVIMDFNEDGKNDLFLGSGGGDFYNKMKPLLNSYYIKGDSVFQAMPVPQQFENASVVRPWDFDGDGDPDLFVGSNAVSADFGNIPNSYLLRNNKGTWEVMENSELQQAGMVTDALWDDFDDDGATDLILVGEWMAPAFYKNTNGKFRRVQPMAESLSGLWQCIVSMDIDGDGDRDYILGNWGTNGKFRATPSEPLRMYYGDLDENGSTETVLAMAKQGTYYPLEGLQVLAGQMIGLRKKFTNYRDYAGKPVEQVLDPPALKKAKVFEVSELRSGYLENRGGSFHFVPFGDDLQLAPITALLRFDFDKDGSEEVLAAGNYFGVQPYHGRYGSFPGAMIAGKNDVVLGSGMGLDFSQKSARDLNIITLAGQSYLLVTFNNEKAEVYRILQKD